jgi:hypothetical protein
VRKTSFKKVYIKRPKWRMNPFSLTALRLGLVCSYFLASCSFFSSPTAGILGMMWLKTLSFPKARNLLRVTLTQ